MLLGRGSGGRIRTELTGTPLPWAAASSSFFLNSLQRLITPLMTSWGWSRGMSFTAAETSTTVSPLSTPSLKSSKNRIFMMASWPGGPAAGSLDGNEDAVAELAVHRLREMPLAGGVLDEDHLARADHPALAVARGDLHAG